MKKEIGVIGLGKMGKGIALQLKEKGWTVHGFDPDKEIVGAVSREGVKGADSAQALVPALSAPRIIWLMVPHAAVDDSLFGENGIAAKLSEGDVVIDGGNSYFKEGIERAEKLSKLGIKFIDVGFSGGPYGARNGGCLMIGGDEASFKDNEQLFRDLAVEDGYQFFTGAGAGHFVKMVHNGIEYGMMQALGEGFALLKASPYKLDLTRVADIYNHGSVIESRLVGWVKSAFQSYGTELSDVSGTVAHTGEGEWTAKNAKEMGIDVPIIEGSYKFRVESEKTPSYIGKIVSALRNQFGGHNIKK